MAARLIIVARSVWCKRRALQSAQAAHSRAAEGARGLLRADLSATLIVAESVTNNVSAPMLPRSCLRAERKDLLVIVDKFWRTFKAQANKLANLVWTADPIGQMQYEYDLAVEQLQGGREGLEQYRALIERVNRQVTKDKSHERELAARVEAYLAAGERDTAGRFALELARLRDQIADNESQLELQERAYANNVAKIKLAAGRLSEVRQRIAQHKSELKMTRAEAEIAKLASSFDFDITTNFGQIEQIIQDKVSLNRARVRVASDLSTDGLVEVEQQQALEKALADQALRQFETDKQIAGGKTIVIDSAAPRIESDGQR